jgi:hypothetical protein
MASIHKASRMPTFGVLRKAQEETQNVSAATLSRMLSLQETLMADVFVDMADREGYKTLRDGGGGGAGDGLVCFDLGASLAFDDLSGIEAEYYKGDGKTLAPLVHVDAPRSPYVDVFDISELLAVSKEVETGRMLPLAFSDIGQSLPSSDPFELNHYLLETDFYATVNGYRGHEFGKPVLFALAELVFHPETNSPVVRRRFQTALMHIRDHPDAFDLATKYNGFILADYVDMLGQKYGAQSDVTPAIIDDVAISQGGPHQHHTHSRTKPPHEEDVEEDEEEEDEDEGEEEREAIKWIDALAAFRDTGTVNADAKEALHHALPVIWDRHCYVKQWFDVLEADLTEEQEAVALEILEDVVKVHVNCVPIVQHIREFVRQQRETAVSQEAFRKTVRYLYLLTLPISTNAYVNWLKETGQESKPDVGAHLMFADADDESAK